MDNIYYNLNTICQKINPTDPDEPCRFYETRPNAIVTRSNDYEFSLIRASIDSSNIPCFIPKIAQVLTNPDVTKYVVQMTLSLTLNGSTTEHFNVQPLLYVCRNKYTNTTPLDNYSPYYYIFDLQQFVDMVNATFQSIYNTLQTSLDVTFISKCPKMVLNGTTFSMYYDARGYGGTDSTASGAQQEAFSILINDDLKNLLRNFNMTYSQDLENNTNWQLIVSNRIANNQTINGILYYVESQSYSSLSTVFSPVSSIVFISNMGIFTEYIGNHQILNSQSITTNQSNNIENQIIDIALSVDNPMDYSSQIQYVASVFRFSNIQINEIRDIDITVYWKNKYNGINYPVLLSDGCGMNCKFLFQKKK